MTQKANQTRHIHIELPQGERSIRVDDCRQSLSEILRHDALPLNTRCGQRGLCDGCMVELVSGRVVHRASGAAVEARGEAVALRGCEYRPDWNAPLRLRVLTRSLLAHEPQVVTSFRLNVPRAHDPLWQEAIPSGQRALGAAIDIGTTTVAILLVDLATGDVVGQASGFNRQMHLGDDVLTRINLCLTEPPMVRRLQEAVVETIDSLLAEAMSGRQDTAAAPETCGGGNGNGYHHAGSNGNGRAGSNGAGAATSDGRIVCVAVAANATMLHLLAGVDPSSMGMAPFTPTFLTHRVDSSRRLGLMIPGQADVPVHLLPSASAYIGADLCAGAVASGLLYDEGPSLLIDVGTNGEIILNHRGRLIGCATAAGPAFEGAKLAAGVRAGRGAIEDIRFGHEPFAVHTGVIGGGKPIGVCGSAYVDLLAEGRRIQLLDEAGRFQPDRVPGASPYLIDDPMHGLSLRVGHAAGREAILISERDIAALLQAKAAIGAGILTLLARAGLTPPDIRRVYLAGGFGMHIRVVHAIACGLLPGFEPAQVEVVGNTSLGGAYLSLLDRHLLDEMARVGERLEVVELNLDPQFESRYIDQLMLPTP